MRPVAKRSTIRATLDFIRTVHSTELLATIVESLSQELRARIDAMSGSSVIAYADVLALWRAADVTLAPIDPHWIERAGAYSIESSAAQMHSGILRKRSPNEFLTESVSLFQLYYAPGDMQVVEEEDDRAVLRLSGFESLDPLFCRRQTGGLQCALSLAGGDKPRAKHVRCTHEGDAFCEWEMCWGKRDRPEAADGRRETGDGSGDAFHASPPAHV
jgi:hypothetical protein